MPGGRPHRARMSGNRQPRRTAARWGPSDSYSEGPHSHLPHRRHEPPARARPHPVPPTETSPALIPPVTLAPPVYFSYVPCAEPDKPPPKSAPCVGKVSAVHDHPTPNADGASPPPDERPAEGRPDRASRRPARAGG